MSNAEELYAQRMEECWQEIRRAYDQGASATEMQRLYSAYLAALDGYNAATGFTTEARPQPGGEAHQAEDA